VIALFFYMSTARANQEMQGLRGVSGAVQLRYRAGATVAEATQTAHSTACGPVARGMNETIACGNGSSIRAGAAGAGRWPILLLPRRRRSGELVTGGRGKREAKLRSWEGVPQHAGPRRRSTC